MPEEETIAAPAPAPANETRPERIARLEREQRAREEQAETEAEDRHVEALELDAELAATVGKRGRDYEVVETPFCVFGVRRPDKRGIQQINKATSDLENIDTDKLAGIVRHYVLPEGKKQIDFHAAASDHGDIAIRATSAIRALLGSEKLDAKKKF